MKHGRSLAELALVVTAVLLVAACGSGPGKAPDPPPTWSPPTWMHGTWTGTGVAGDDGTIAVTGTIDVSAYNLVASFQVGVVAYPLDVKMAEQGGASVQSFDESNEGKPIFGLRIVPDAAGTAHSFICGREDSATMSCNWTTPGTDGMFLTVVLTKQPG